MDIVLFVQERCLDAAAPHGRDLDPNPKAGTNIAYER